MNKSYQLLIADVKLWITSHCFVQQFFNRQQRTMLFTTSENEKYLVTVERVQ